MQVSQLAAMWLRFKADEISASTLYTYERIVRTRVCPMLGDRAIDSIEAVELQTLLMRALTDRSENEALKTRAVLRGMFGYAADLGLIDESPAARIRLPRGTGNARAGIRRVPTLEDARQMSRHLGDAYSLMPLLAAFAGLRWQEVAALRPEDFETETRIITIERALGRHGGMKEPKSSAGRRKTVWAAEAHDQIVSFLAGRDAQGWLLLSERGRLLHYPNWRNRCWVPASR